MYTKFTSVAPIESGAGGDGRTSSGGQQDKALMILGADRAVDDAVKKDTMSEEGMYEVGVVALD